MAFRVYVARVAASWLWSVGLGGVVWVRGFKQECYGTGAITGQR